MSTATNPVAVSGIDCVCYLAKDLARARNFYQNVLGLKPSTEAENWVEYELSDGTTFAIARLDGDRWFPAGGAMFAVPDVHAALERLRASGVTIYTEEVMDTAVCHQAWCEDTEGNNLCVHKRK
jgi:predicted enzyme related to lactoylglutathione lyase